MRIFILVVLWQCEFTIIHGQVILNVGQKYILQKNISDIFVVKNYSNTVILSGIYIPFTWVLQYQGY